MRRRPTRAGNSGWGLGAADFDRDGYPDIASADRVGAVNVLRNQSGQGFAAPIHIMTEMTTQGMAIADYNGDGLPDIAVVNKASNSFSVILNTSH
jgi:FG-GAP-like repeat